MQKLFVAISFIFLSATCFANENSLIGCWADKSITQYAPDGSQRIDTSNACSLKFSGSTITSRCAAQQGESVTEYSYQLDTLGVYVATITNHNLRPDLIGNTRKYVYEVTSTTLTITTNPQTSKPAPSNTLARVVSESHRTVCE